MRSMYSRPASKQRYGGTSGWRRWIAAGEGRAIDQVAQVGAMPEIQGQNVHVVGLGRQPPEGCPDGWRAFLV